MRWDPVYNFCSHVGSTVEVKFFVSVGLSAVGLSYSKQSVE